MFWGSNCQCHNTCLLQLAKMPEQLKGGFQMSEFSGIFGMTIWHWLSVQQVLFLYYILVDDYGIVIRSMFSHTGNMPATITYRKGGNPDTTLTNQLSVIQIHPVIVGNTRRTVWYHAGIMENKCHISPKSVNNQKLPRRSARNAWIFGRNAQRKLCEGFILRQQLHWKFHST